MESLTNKRAKRAIVASVTLSLAVSSLLAGCATSTPSVSPAASSAGDAEVATAASTALTTYAEATSLLDLEYTDRDLETDWQSRDDLVEIDLTSLSSASDAILEQGVLKITKAGTYVISGSCTQIVVQAADDDKVQIVLDSASISNPEGPAIYVANANKVFITTAKGTSNIVSDGSSYSVQADNGDEVNAAIYSTCDLTLNGEGTLSVTGNKEHAVYSKDDLVIASGNYSIDSAGDAIRGKDSVKIAGGTFDIECEGDAIKSSEEDFDDKGFVIIDDGEFVINAGDDAIHAETVLGINGGAIDIQSCAEGLEGEKVYVNAGDTKIVSSDDGINAVARGASTEPDMGSSNGFGSVGAGDVISQKTPSWQNDQSADSAVQKIAQKVSAMESNLLGDDAGEQAPSQVENASTQSQAHGVQNRQAPQSGIDSNAMTPPDNLEQNVMEPPENLDSNSAVPPESFIGKIDPSDIPEQSGQPAPDAQSDSPNPFESRMGGVFESDDNLIVAINGGTLTIHSQGDGIDSNGNFEITGGTAYVYGPANSDNSALDLGGKGYANGGVFVGVGSNMMACGFAEGEQGSIFASIDDCSGTITITDSSGNVVASIEDVQQCQSIVATAPEMPSDGTVEIKSTSGMEMTTTSAKEHDTSQMGFGNKGFETQGGKMRDKSAASAGAQSSSSAADAQAPSQDTLKKVGNTNSPQSSDSASAGESSHISDTQRSSGSARPANVGDTIDA